MSILKVTDIQSNGTGFNDVVSFKNASGTQNGTLCRAWVNFNGTGTVAIRDDFNVSSITDNGTGDYTVNFSNALADANYVATCHGSGGTPTNGTNYNRVLEGSPNTTSSVRCIAYAPNNTAIVDIVYCSVAIFH